MLNIITRRGFIATTAAVAGHAAFAQEGRKDLPRSERLNLATIGAGGQGREDTKRADYLGHNIVALCDPDWKVASRLFEGFPNARRHRDYREMLDKETDLDGVIIATPDHHHAPATIRALKAGLHVYCEKPLTHSVWEARQVGEAFDGTTNRSTQMGNTGAASDGLRRIAEMIWDGAIGNVRDVHVWTNRPIWPQGIPRPAETKPVPDTLDWEIWLGPAPERPFHPIYHPFRWRGWWDFGTGALGDIGCHRFHPIFVAMKLKHPRSVEANSSKNNGDSFPHASIVRYNFDARDDMPPMTLHWYDGGLKPDRPSVLPDTMVLNDEGILYVGDEGAILDGQLWPEQLRNGYVPPDPHLPRSIGHWEEWIAGCKGESVKQGSNFAFASTLTEVVLLGNVALSTKQKLHWDGPALKVTNVPEANNLLRREYRSGWAWDAV